LDSHGQQIPLFQFSSNGKQPVWLFAVPKGDPDPNLASLRQYIAKHHQIHQPLSGTILIAGDDRVQELVIKGDKLQPVQSHSIAQLDNLVQERASRGAKDIGREVRPAPVVDVGGFDDMGFDEFSEPSSEDIAAFYDDQPPGPDRPPSVDAPSDSGLDLDVWGLG
jgi:hypothetical protein